MASNGSGRRDTVREIVGNVRNCWAPPPPSPGALVPPPSEMLGKGSEQGGGGCPHPSSRFCGSENVREMSGKYSGLGGAPPQPLPGLVVPPKMFGKCWGNVRKMFGTGRGEHPHPPISGVVVSQIFRTWGGGLAHPSPGYWLPGLMFGKWLGNVCSWQVPPSPPLPGWWFS